MTPRPAPEKLSQISGLEEEWMVEWDGGHAIARGVTAFLAHATVPGAPAFGSCVCWQWDEDTKAHPDKETPAQPRPKQRKKREYEQEI